MFNLFDAIRDNENYNRLKTGDFLLAEYTCGLSERKVAVWTQTEHLLHVVSGSKAWHTIDGVCERRDMVALQETNNIAKTRPRRKLPPSIWR